MFLHKKAESGLPVVAALRRWQAGQSLFEALLALAVFVTAIAVIAHLFLGAYYSAVYSSEKSQAVFLAREGIGAVRSMRDADFENMGEKTDAGIVLSDNKWTFQDDPDETGKFTRQIDILDISNNEEAIWQVTSTITWQSLKGGEISVSFVENLTAWRLPQTYSLALVVDPEGSGTAEDLTNNSPYEENTVVDIKAVPEEGYAFVNWTTDDGGTFGNANEAETTYTMPGNDATITANFVL